MATLTDLSEQLHAIADQLTQLSEAIVKAHTDLGNQLQQAVQAQQSSVSQPVAEPPAMASEQKG